MPIYHNETLATRWIVTYGDIPNNFSSAQELIFLPGYYYLLVSFSMKVILTTLKRHPASLFAVQITRF